MTVVREAGIVTGRFAALRVRNFRIFFSGLVISVSGPWMQTTAQAWLVLKLTGSSLSLATVASLQFLPIMLLALIGGAMADRFPRRKLMFATQALAAIQAVVLGLLVATDAVTIWHVYALALTLGVINALDTPLRQSFVSELVPVSQLPNAVALTAMVQNMGRIIGPALGGVVIALFGVEAAFFLNAVTFSAILVALTRLRAGELQPTRFSTKSNVLRQIGDSLQYAWNAPSILFLLIATAFIGMFGQNFTTMVPLVANFLVHASAAEFGLLNSCLGTGSFSAAFLLAGRGAPTTRRILLAGLGFGIILIAISLSESLWLSCALFFGVGACAVTFSASVTASLQMQSPPDMRGRFAAMIHLLITGSSPFGAMLTGFVAETAGVAASVFANGALCCAGMAVALAYWRRSQAAGRTAQSAAEIQIAPVGRASDAAE